MSIGSESGTEVFTVEVITDGNVSHLLTGAAIEYVYLIEDIYSMSITGKISFWDRIGLMENGPINGNEIFRVTFGNTGGTGDYRVIDMRVNKIAKVVPVSGAQMTANSKLELILVDDKHQLLHSQGIHRAWTDTKLSTIISDICDKHVDIPTSKFVTFEETVEDIPHFDTHLRTPAENIQWLMNRGSGVKTEQPGYLFYRYNDAKSKKFGYALTTLEDLLRQKRYMEPKGDNDIYVFEQPNIAYINKINDYKLLHLDLNALKSLTGGSLLGFDMKRKKFLRQDYDYKSAIDRFTILGKKTLFPNDMLISRPKKEVDGDANEDILDNLWYGNWIREYCTQQLLEITVQGHQSRHAGGMIRVGWPSIDAEKKLQNKQMDGKYLIKSVTHYFSNSVTGGYKQRLVCIKNGYGDSSNKNLVKSVNKNLGKGS